VVSNVISYRPPGASVSGPRPWLFAAVYAVHLLDEGLVAGGLPRWSTELGFHFTLLNWLSVSSLSFLLFSATVWWVARRTWPSWVLVALAVHITLHALLHIGASAWWHSLSPGTVSGLVLALPLAGWTLRWAWLELPRKTFVLAALLGAATFQAPWDLLVRIVFGLPMWTS
jgi:hypothetical protein